MAIGTGVTEIADSEEEPMTSSPAAVPDATVDKLSATVGQGIQAVACPHQEVAEHTANEASECAGVSDVDQEGPSTVVGRVYINRSELQSAHQAATNNVSACAIDITQSTDGSPQEIVGAAVGPEQGGRMTTIRTDDEAGSSRDEGTLPEARHAPALDERANMQMNQQKHPSEPEKNSQHCLQECPISTSGCTNVQQDEMSREHLQDLAVDRHNTELSLSQSDSGQPASGEQELEGIQNASTVSQEGSPTAAIEALATKPGCETVRETTIESPNAASVHYPEAYVAGQNAPGSVNEPDPMDLDVISEAIDITSSGGISGEHISAIEPTNDATMPGENPQHTTQLTATSVPAVHAGHAVGRNDREAVDGASIAPHPSTQDKRTDEHSLLSGQPVYTIMPNVTAIDTSVVADAPLSQHSSGPSNEQDPPEAHLLTDAAKGEAAEPGLGVVAQDAGDVSQPGSGHVSSTADGRNVASVVFGVQTESQSAASQASKPNSPVPAAELSPQEITLAELRAQKAALLSSLRVQPSIQVLMEENDDDDGEPTEGDIMAAANKIVKEHIKLLHEYNELKDVGQGLMGLIADQRGVRIIEIQDEFGIDAND